MLKYFLILSLLIPVQFSAQEELPPSESEKMVDSILNQFNPGEENNFDSVSKEEQEKMIVAEEKYMNELLLLERDREDAKKFKTYLRILIGSVLLIVTIIVLRNSKKRKVAGR